MAKIERNKNGISSSLSLKDKFTNRVYPLHPAAPDGKAGAQNQEKLRPERSGVK